MDQTTIHPFEPCIDSNSNKLYNEDEVKKIASDAINQVLLAYNTQSNLENCSYTHGNVSSEEVKHMPRMKKTVHCNGRDVFVTANDANQMIEKLTQMLADQSKSVIVPSKTPLFKDYAQHWLETYKQPTLKPTTLYGLKNYLKNHFIPFFGAMHVGEINADIIQTFLNKRSNLSQKTLKDLLMWLRQILDYAVEDGHLTKNPAQSKRIRIPSNKREERKLLNEDQYGSVLRAIPLLENQNDRLLIAIELFTGIRRGELLGLKYSDIDDANGFIHVKRNAVYPGTARANISTPKSEAGIRKIPILDELKPYLPDRRDDAYIFHAAESETDPMSLQQFKNTMTRINRQIDLHGVTMHGLRHTFITQAVASMDIKSAQAIAGHASAKMTLDQYAHAQEKQMILASSDLNKRLKMIGTSVEHPTPAKPA